MLNLRQETATAWRDKAEAKIEKQQSGAPGVHWCALAPSLRTLAPVDFHTVHLGTGGSSLDNRHSRSENRVSKSIQLIFSISVSLVNKERCFFTHCDYLLFVNIGCGKEGKVKKKKKKSSIKTYRVARLAIISLVSSFSVDTLTWHKTDQKKTSLGLFSSNSYQSINFCSIKR